MKRKLPFLMAVVLLLASVVTVQADKLSDLQKKQQELEQKEQQIQQNAQNTENQMNDALDKADELQGTIDELDLAMDEVNTSIVEIMTEISLIESDITNKEADIATTQEEYEAAQEQKQQQYEAMCIRIKCMYETGNENYVELLLTAGSIPELLNKADYVEAMYAYDRDMLEQYEETVTYVAQVEQQLESELADLEVSKSQLDDAQAELDVELAKLKAESGNYEQELAQAKVQAANFSSELKKQQSELKSVQSDLKNTKLQIAKEQESKQSASSSTTQKVAAGKAVFDANEIWNASGSELGKKVAVYACSFIGNPYVAGGTSLTNGADCSGYTQSVMAQFGVSIPRTSYEQRLCGTEVSYDNAQPGDLICYAGHVAIYIGNGKIVHASSERTGIKVGYANYRTILSVRRVL